MKMTNSLRLKLSLGVAALAAGVAAPSPAVAQDADASGMDAPGVVDIEVPALVLDTGDDGGGGGEDDTELDLANVVQSAARSVTTVQEAPVIVTVITSEEIAERQVRNIFDLIDTVPGYLSVGIHHSQFPHGTVRGQNQAAQYLHDGVSLFEPFVNVAAQNEIVPIELIKRVELITGPGGVLWGANSLLGITNVITKDAEDLVSDSDSWGAEVGVRGADGNGNRKYMHGYVMAGKTELFSDDSKLLIHGMFKTYQGPGYQMPQQLFSAPLPQPNSAVLYGPLTTANPEQSFLFSGFAKLTIGKTQIRVMVPYTQRHLPMGFPGIVIDKDHPQDDRPECQNTDLDGDGDIDNADLIVPGDGCFDKAKASRDNNFQYYDRYAVIEHRTRLAGGKAGVAVKAYVNQFVRQMSQIQVLAPIEGLLEGGLAFGADLSTFRAGAAIDGDAELGAKARVLYGVEAFREWVPNDVKRARQGDGLEANFVAPYQEERLPLPCPRERDPDNPGASRFIDGCPLTFSFPGSRTALSAYVSPQWRPNKKLILDVGARVAVAPEALGENFYDPQLTFGGTAVYNFLPAWHAKLNYSQGFRPPVFNNLNSNGEAVQLDGRPDLSVETADALQGEINARLFKGERRIRELSFRLDYSYTRIQNLIQIVGGRYQNTADRGIQSVEFLGKLYIQGGHRIELGYTYMDINTADKGELRAIPNHWFNLLGVYNVSDDKLRAFSNVRILGAMEDANRLVEHRNLHYCTAAENDAMMCGLGDVLNESGTVVNYIRTQPTDLVMDRLPASAELSIGLTYTPTDKLEISAEAFNAFNGRYYQPDTFFDYEPRLEFMPNPREDVRVFVGANYKY